MNICHELLDLFSGCWHFDEAKAVAPCMLLFLLYLLEPVMAHFYVACLRSNVSMLSSCRIHVYAANLNTV